jgi:hypothetical protein
VQYFFRKSDLSAPANFDMMPDTNFIFQAGEGGSDGHRWQQFSVLPDRWKDNAFGVGGTGMACMLYYNISDNRGDETQWVSVADTIGMTTANKWGAHNGWHARGDQDPTNGLSQVETPDPDTSWAVRAHIGQPGTLWDMWQQKAAESGAQTGTLASRTAPQQGGLFQNPGHPAAGVSHKYGTSGPSGAMLRAFYKVIMADAGDLEQNNWFGPTNDKADDDVGLFTDFANNAAGQVSKPRGVWAVGRGFISGMNQTPISKGPFAASYFGSTLRADFYRTATSNTNNTADLFPVSPINTSGSIYGVNNFCTIENDILNISPVATGPQPQAVTFYENIGGAIPGPYIASIYTPAGPGAGDTHQHATMVDGFRHLSMGSRYTLTPGGLRSYVLDVLVNIWGTLNCRPTATPIGVGDDPGSQGTFVNFMNLRSENPMRSGQARIAFGVTKTEKVEVKVYDVTGRLVKTVANRTFQGGVEHVVTWDGTNDSGQPVARGVYFYQLRSPSFVSQKKLAVLRN